MNFFIETLLWVFRVVAIATFLYVSLGALFSFWYLKTSPKTEAQAELLHKLVGKYFVKYAQERVKAFRNSDFPRLALQEAILADDYDKLSRLLSEIGNKIPLKERGPLMIFAIDNKASIKIIEKIVDVAVDSSRKSADSDEVIESERVAVLKYKLKQNKKEKLNKKVKRNDLYRRFYRRKTKSI